MPGVAVCIGALAPVEPSQRSAVFPADRIELAAPPLEEPQTMPWQKIGELPDQRFVGPYGIEFWRIHKGQVFHQGGLLRKPDAASFEFIPRTLFRRARCARRLPRQDRPARDRPRQLPPVRWLLAGQAQCLLRIRDFAESLGRSRLRHLPQYERWLRCPYCGRCIKHCLRGELLQTIPQDPLYAVDDSNVYCDGKPLPGGIARAGSCWMDTSRAMAAVSTIWSGSCPRWTWRWLEGSWSRYATQLFTMHLVEMDAGVRGRYGFE